MKRKWPILFLMVAPLLAYAADAEVSSGGDVMSALWAALAAVLISLLGYVGKLAGRLINKKIQDIDNDVLQKAAYVAVRFVNDAFKKLPGNEKFNMACANVARKLPGVDKDDISDAIHAMYVNFNAEMPKNS